jgi:hypothetical protein
VRKHGHAARPAGARGRVSDGRPPGGPRTLLRRTPTRAPTSTRPIVASRRRQDGREVRR